MVHGHIQQLPSLCFRYSFKVIARHHIPCNVSLILNQGLILPASHEPSTVHHNTTTVFSHVVRQNLYCSQLLQDHHPSYQHCLLSYISRIPSGSFQLLQGPCFSPIIVRNVTSYFYQIAAAYLSYTVQAFPSTFCYPLLLNLPHFTFKIGFYSAAIYVPYILIKSQPDYLSNGCLKKKWSSRF